VFSCHEIGKFEKAQFTNNGVIQLYIAREGSESGGKLPDSDPAKRSGSGSATLFPIRMCFVQTVLWIEELYKAHL